MTIKLYDENSYLTSFEATVISCEKIEDKYKTELDKTAFFPEEGGQCADGGTIDGIEVTYVELCGDKIYHYTDKPFEIGKSVKGEIDFGLRFRNMQNHTGEHIISGIAHRLYGYENVGFHLGCDNVTMDLSGPLRQDDIDKIELLANEIVYKNMAITAVYPSNEELLNINYRAKGEIKENIRIVTIGDADCCACCAPHVKQTGEVGIIKILSFMNYKGGTRLTIACGKDALCDYMYKHRQNENISTLLSVKQNETFRGVEKLIEDIGALNSKLSEKSGKIAKYITKDIKETDENIIVFADDLDVPSLRMIANDIKDKTKKIAVVLSGDDESGYKYVIISKDSDVLKITKNANNALSGRGGGRDNMATGTFGAKGEEIEKYFKMQN